MALWLVLILAASPLPEERTTPPAEWTLRERLAGFSVAAHRGGSWSPAGNTIRRFERARRAGADIIEMDLQLTADGVPVVYHDAALRKLLRTGPAIDTLTLEAVKRHKVALVHEIPTFEEVLQWAAGRVVINAEFKSPDVVAPAVGLVQAHAAHNWVYFQTKSDRARYETARTLDARVALLFKPETEEDIAWALGLEDPYLAVIEIHQPLLSPEYIARIHASGKLASFNAWRLTLLQEFFESNARELFEMGIDIAVTKRPRSAARQRDRLEAGLDWFEVPMLRGDGITILQVESDG